MNKIVLATDLTEEQKAKVILEYGQTWDNVESVNFQLRKDGSISNFNVNYNYEESTGSDVIDGMNLIFANKHSREYQSAKKRVSASNNGIDRARQTFGGRK